MSAFLVSSNQVFAVCTYFTYNFRNTLFESVLNVVGYQLQKQELFSHIRKEDQEDLQDLLNLLDESESYDFAEKCFNFLVKIFVKANLESVVQNTEDLSSMINDVKKSNGIFDEVLNMSLPQIFLYLNCIDYQCQDLDNYYKSLYCFISGELKKVGWTRFNLNGEYNDILR